MMTSEQPVWICEGCGEALSGDDGVIATSYEEIQRYKDAVDAWEAAHPDETNARELMSYPSAVPWHVFHDRCGGSSSLLRPYEIESDRIDTWRKVASWSAHLHEKGWFPVTGWDSLLRKAGAGEA